MKTEYLKIYTSSLIIINSMRNLLAENNITSLVKNHPESARLGGFGITLDSVELFILKKDLEKSEPIVNAFKKEINS
jgi:hypothetical protein